MASGQGPSLLTEPGPSLLSSRSAFFPCLASDSTTLTPPTPTPGSEWAKPQSYPLGPSPGSGVQAGHAAATSGPAAGPWACRG